MTDDPQDGKTELAAHFDDKHGAQVVPAYFSSPKMAVGEAYIVDISRIKPSDEEYEKVFGRTEEEFNLLPIEQQEARKKSFVEEQLSRFEDAHKRAITTYENYLSDAENAPIEIQDIVKEVLGAEVRMVSDHTFKEGIQTLIKSGQSAEVALDGFYEEQISTFMAMGDEYLRARATELQQHRATMQHHLHPDKTLSAINDVKKGDILIMPSISLSAVSALCDSETGEKKVSGVLVDEGSLESHAAIIIDALGIPYGRLKQDDMKHIKNRDPIVMDGSENMVLLHPNKSVIKGYEGEVDKREEQFQALAKDSTKTKSVKTRDGEKVNIHANYAASFESHMIRETNPVSIGLYRTEVAADMRYDKESET